MPHGGLNTSGIELSFLFRVWGLRALVCVRCPVSSLTDGYATFCCLKRSIPTAMSRLRD